MDWSHQTVLITGAGGFIGSHLAERLAELGARLRAFIEYNSEGSCGWLDCSPRKGDMEVVAGDIRDPDTLKGPFRDVDIVFHLAALIAIPHSYRAPLSYVRTNVEGTLNVFQAARDAEVTKVVHTSTSEVYGTARYVPIDEGHPLQGQSPYAASKIGADKIAEAFYFSYELPVATLRPFNTYGPHQSARAVIPTIVTQALTAGEVRLGSLAPTRDFTYVADTVEGFVKIAECQEAVGEVVNLGTGQDIAIGKLCEKILRLMGSSARVVQDERRHRPDESEVERLQADNTKARELLGWSPGRSLEDGLVSTIEWFRANVGRYKGDVYAV